MKISIPKKAPCGDDPGRHFLEEDEPLYLINIDLSDK